MKTEVPRRTAGAHRASPEMGDALAHLADALCRMIRQGLSCEHHRHDGVHRARKAIRSLRALLALTDAAFGASAEAVDRSLRRLGRSLSALRDGHVAVATARALAHGGEAQAWRDVADRLEQRSARQLAEALARDPAFAGRRRRLARMRRALAALPWGELERASLDRALRKSERRAAKAQRQASTHTTAARLHRWRRRSRRLRMQVDVMRRVDVASTAVRKTRQKRIDALTTLTDRLGRRQDLEVLARLLPKVADASSRVALLRRLTRAMTELDRMD